jgi:hypothetical protein
MREWVSGGGLASDERGGSRMKQLEEEDPMPFGGYQGTPMIDVPAEYLFWLWTNEKDPMSKRVKTDPVADYIHRNRSALMREYPDGIWET